MSNKAHETANNAGYSSRNHHSYLTATKDARLITLKILYVISEKKDYQ